MEMVPKVPWEFIRFSQFLSCQFAQSLQNEMPARQPLDIARALAKSTTILDKLKTSQSPQEEFGVDQGVARTKTEYAEVLNGGGSGGEALQQVGGFASRRRNTQRNFCFTIAAISAVCGRSS